MKTSKQSVSVLKRPNLTKLRKLLQTVLFNPNLPGPMKIVADQGSVEYYETAALISINKARDARVNGCKQLAEQHYIQAQQLLLLARAYSE